jgi:hypothetical protein
VECRATVAPHSVRKAPSRSDHAPRQAWSCRLYLLAVPNSIVSEILLQKPQQDRGGSIESPCVDPVSGEQGHRRPTPESGFDDAPESFRDELKFPSSTSCRCGCSMWQFDVVARCGSSIPASSTATEIVRILRLPVPSSTSRSSLGGLLAFPGCAKIGIRECVAARTGRIEAFSIAS